MKKYYNFIFILLIFSFSYIWVYWESFKYDSEIWTTSIERNIMISNKWIINKKDTLLGYNPDGLITRAEIAKIVANVSWVWWWSCNGDIFEDVDSSLWDLCWYIENLAKNNMISMNKKYRPKINVSLAEISKMLYNASSIKYSLPKVNSSMNIDWLVLESNIGDLWPYVIASILNWYIKVEDKSNFTTLYSVKRQEVFNIIFNILKKEDTLILEWDFYNDSSIYRFVSPWTWLTNKEYIPNDRTYTSWIYINDLKWKNKTELRLETKIALEKLWEEFREYFWHNIPIVSAYRSYNYQARISNWCSPTLCAKPGHSEHQLGLAIDVASASTQQSYLANSTYKSYYEWMLAHAHKYWFTLSYQRWAKLDWYQNEPWHWRFVGIQFATYLKNNNMAFTQYIQENFD